MAEQRPSLPLEIIRTLGAWVRGQVLVLAITALIYAMGFAILGVPLWPLLAVFCALMHLVPLFGPILAVLIPLAVTLIGGGNEWRALGVVGVYIVTQAIEGFILTPRIIGRKVSLHPAAVFLAILLGGLLFGFVGILLAVPVLAVVAVVWRHYRREA